jgi:ubiquinone/menaquinone biosynthesis C-methylase UbiE
MVDLTNLDPAIAAEHFRNPRGEIGVALADSMSQRNAPIYQAAGRRLGAKPDERLLEVGFGNGKLVPGLIALAPGLTYAGIDISETMVSAAEAFNKGLIEAGRAIFRLGTVEVIPFPDESFDRALTINTIYFWPEPVRALAEIRRVLRKDGVVVASVGTPETMVRLPPAQHGFRVYDEAQLRDLHQKAGFRSVEVDRYRDAATTPDGNNKSDRESFLVISVA